MGIDAKIDVSYVGRLERGTENPTIGLLDRLSHVLGVHVSELLQEPDPLADPAPRLKPGRKPRGQR
ncbi:helix-turn-helix domain-containing protein [Methylopila sp. Yamaguchi]|uniref:helix-turn-helix domain-containing protein n=1 Tax=Methylopila sp. Yamaguchi TaxID=1437817 RepID=UPI004037FC57